MTNPISIIPTIVAIGVAGVVAKKAIEVVEDKQKKFDFGIKGVRL